MNTPSESPAPVRVQRSRKKGSNLPENTVCVCRPGKWGNPFKVGDLEYAAGGPARVMTAEMAVKRYEFWLTKDIASRDLRRALPTLKGKNLACWCRIGSPCHADVLLRLANSEITGR